MRPDLDEIRAALAAATPAPWTLSREIRRWLNDADSTVVANAPTWLAALCAEIERLRAQENTYINQAWAERDAALAECARLRDGLEEVHISWATAMAEYEQLKAGAS